MTNELKAPECWLTQSPEILVIGAGGTGSEVLSRLFKLNFLIQKLGGNQLNITVADGDIVSEFNIGRQNFYNCDIGFNKADILINRFNAFGNCNWRSIARNLAAKDVEDLEPDIVVTCVDSGNFRADLGKHFKKRTTNILWLDGGNDSHSGQVVIGHLGKHLSKVPNVYDLFGRSLRTVSKDSPSCSTEQAIQKQTFGINSQIAEVMCQLIWQLLRFTKIEQHIVYTDVQRLETTAIGVSEQQWALYGYKKAS